jgi:hypothetical protein
MSTRRRKVDPTVPIKDVASNLATAADSAIAAAEGSGADDGGSVGDALSDTPLSAGPSAEPQEPARKRRGRPPGSRTARKGPAKRDEAAAAAEAQTRMILTMVAGSLGETIFHDLAKIEAPRWEHAQADALAQVWTPYVQEKLAADESGAYLRIYATIGILSPFIIAALRKLAESRTALRKIGE